MKSKKSRIVIDLTDLEKWSGHYGGIQRVVYGITEEIENTDTNVEYIAFSTEYKKFYRTNFDSIRNRSNEQQFESSSGPTRLRDLLVKRVPVRIKANQQIQRIARKAGILKDQEDGDSIQFTFLPSDTVLIIGMAWESPGLQELLMEEKQRLGFRVAQVVYDLVICLYPHLHHPANIAPYNHNMILAIKNSELLLAISKSSAKDLQIFANKNKLRLPEVRVLRLGDSLEDSNVRPIKPSQAINKEFIACIGTVEVRKNHTLLYYAYKLAHEKGVELPQLIIVGGSGWYAGDIQYLINNDPDLKDKIILMHDVDDPGRAWIYQNCLFTVYPSMYEGWGLPVAESLALGKPCIASNSSSIPEIGGRLVDYFSPYNPLECMEAIQSYSIAKVREAKAKQIRQEYIITSWRQTADQVLEFIWGKV